MYSIVCTAIMMMMMIGVKKEKRREREKEREKTTCINTKKKHKARHFHLSISYWYFLLVFLLRSLCRLRWSSRRGMSDRRKKWSSPGHHHHVHIHSLTVGNSLSSDSSLVPEWNEIFQEEVTSEQRSSLLPTDFWSERYFDNDDQQRILLFLFLLLNAPLVEKESHRKWNKVEWWREKSVLAQDEEDIYTSSESIIASRISFDPPVAAFRNKCSVSLLFEKDSMKMKTIRD